MLIKAGLFLVSLAFGQTEIPKDTHSGIYCRSLATMGFVVELGLAGGRAAKIVSAINNKVPKACLYSPIETRTENMEFVRAIPEKPDFAIFKAKVDWVLAPTILANGHLV